MNDFADPSARPRDYSRRGVLVASLYVIGAASLSGIVPVWTKAANAGATSSTSDLADKRNRFLSLSSFLTGKSDLNALTGRRTYEALVSVESDFDSRFVALEVALKNAQLPDMAAFDESSVGKDATLRATAVEIVSAWYLGHVGKGSQATLLSYHDALMYRPTARLTTIPSYELGGYGYWAGKPLV